MGPGWKALIAGAAVLAAWYLWLAIRTGAAYKAKILATLLFVRQREADPNRADDVSADSYRFMRLFAAQVDRETRQITTSLLGLMPQVAVWRDGAGVTLTQGRALPAWPSPPKAPPSAELARGAASTTLDDAVAHAFTEPNPQRRRRTHAVVVMRGGEIIAEQYANGFSASSLFPGWSMAKAAMSALVGVAVGEERLRTEDQELWPSWRGRDSRAKITLEDLLRMRSGLRFTEVYTRAYSDVLRMLYREPDMAAYAANLPHIAPAGKQWKYSSGTTNILSAILKRAVGPDSYPTWPYRALFHRIGMNSVVLEPDAAGTFVMSSYMLATARDWARFGQLHLQDGRWQGSRILPEGWVHFCTMPTPQSDDGNFGAHWYLKLNADVGGKSPAAKRLPADAYFTVGHEGQTLTVIPSLDLVVVRHGQAIYIDAWNQAEFIANILDALDS